MSIINLLIIAVFLPIAHLHVKSSHPVVAWLSGNALALRRAQLVGYLLSSAIKSHDCKTRFISHWIEFTV